MFGLLMINLFFIEKMTLKKDHVKFFNMYWVRQLSEDKLIFEEKD